MDYTVLDIYYKSLRIYNESIRKVDTFLINSLYIRNDFNINLVNVFEASPQRKKKNFKNQKLKKLIFTNYMKFIKEINFKKPKD